MISNEKMEKLWWQYKNEGEGKEVHHITVTGLPEQTGDLPEEAIEPETIAGPTEVVSSTTNVTEDAERVRIMIHIRMSNGMQVSRKNKDYRELRDLVGKLEICRIKL